MANTPSYVRTYLDISTAHLPMLECHSLTTYGWITDEMIDREHAHVVVVEHPHGLWVHVPDAERTEDVDREGHFPVLHTIILHARTLGASWINFDSDADLISDLPHFAW